MPARVFVEERLAVKRGCDVRRKLGRPAQFVPSLDSMRRAPRNLCHLVLAAAFSTSACNEKPSSTTAPSLSMLRDDKALSSADPSAPGSILGAVARRVPIRARPSAEANVLGYLAAGALVQRADTVVSGQGCAGGWYAVTPRGYVCSNEQTTIDRNHPTLQVRGLAPNLTSNLPFAYASTQRNSTSFEPDPRHRDGVRERGSIGKGSTFAVVGSWNTLDEYDQRQQLAMLTLGVFVPVRDIKAVPAGEPLGAALDDSTLKSPLGLALNRKLPTYRIHGDTAVPHTVIDLGSTRNIALSAKSRTVNGQRFWQNSRDTYVSESDVIIVRRRHEFPDFANASTRWLDLDWTRGVILLYQGERPVYVARTCAPPERPLPRGTTRVKSKHVTDLSSGTASDAKPSSYDTPWIVELDSGVSLRAMVGQWQPEPSSQAVQLCLQPEDARRVFQFVYPELPSGWHTVNAESEHRQSSPVLIH